ncbi:hypothetical protein [Spiroplasma apis]|uniref:Uncharacterized protein n=1 Tax=Spiroplasma apis B31 TaxID=1276258 RepID=V5RIY1_SPIAP|nr:hypothetical protein [Spiroplasma apis]AHB36041.1 hypothetical protein SAPIS_v1c01950 [Spiroplasma apis B31]
MGFDRDNRRSNDRPRFNNNGRSGGGSNGPSNGRIENFEKPLMELLKSIDEKLEAILNK